MPPKVKVTKEDIVGISLSLVRESGADALNARTIAAKLECSTQPIFSNFATMDELRLAVIEKADELFGEYIKREVESGEYPSYKASGMAYIRFAREEKELFKLLYMRDRSQEASEKESCITDGVMQIASDATGLSGDNIKLFHLEMWAYVHGIATMFATGFLNLDTPLVSRMVTDVYQGLKKQYMAE